MKDNKKIKKYAEALLKSSMKSNQELREITNNLNKFKLLVKEIPQLKYLILTKRVATKQKKVIIENIFNHFFGAIEIDLILILIENDDSSLIAEIIDKFINFVNSNSNMRNIYITSSNQFSDSYKEQISNDIKSKFNINESSLTTFSVDKSIIGGIKIRIGNKIIDGSIATKLQKIKRSLLSV
tara:strand:+ start:201 stop:749 length:549 start_codon:yes stop_codon:yes gene_type:complete